MNQLASNQPPKNHTSGCTEEATTAEQELTAFFKAVMNLFGPEQAELSADDWLNELTALKLCLLQSVNGEASLSKLPRGSPHG
jgi:peroxiredoxin